MSTLITDVTIPNPSAYTISLNFVSGQFTNPRRLQSASGGVRMDGIDSPLAGCLGYLRAQTISHFIFSRLFVGCTRHSGKSKSYFIWGIFTISVRITQDQSRIWIAGIHPLLCTLIHGSLADAF